MSPSPYNLPAHYIIPEPELVFHPERSSDRDHHPLRGLLTYGPFSRSIITQVCDPIRVAFVTAHGQGRLATGLLSEVENRHMPKERRAYLLEFPGFQRLFGVRVVPAVASCHIELPNGLESDLARSQKPHILLADTLTRALSHLQANRNEFDVVSLVVPTAWEPWLVFRDKGEDFDLHDYLKAVTAARNLPLQILRETRAFAYPCRCSVMWRLAIALYCKAGGIPWKLADAEADAAHIGLSYALRTHPTDAQARFITCCSQVFDADGVGLEFIAYDVDDVRVERNYPFLGRGEMRRAMSRSLALYQRRNAGRVPKRVVIHKSTPFKPEEIDGCFDAWPNTGGWTSFTSSRMLCGVACKSIHRSGLAKGTPGSYPCRRGSYMQLDGRNVLLWTQGNVPMAGQKDFFKEGKAIPAPLLLSRFAGHGPFDQTCREVLGLCKMNWNHDGLYDRLPVTMAYAKVLARTIKRMPHLAPRPYQFRFLM